MINEESLNFSQKVFRSSRRLVYSLLGFVSRQALVVVYCYHSISSDNWRFSVSLDEFKKQIEYLLSIAKPISLQDLAGFVDKKKVFTTPSFVLTFDDGHENLLSIKDYLPSLGIRPVVFVLSKPLEANRMEISSNKSLLTNAEILSLHEAGWDIGCHGATHADFATLTDTEIQQEIQEAKQTLERELNLEIKYFAYPKGKYNPKIINAVKVAGFKLAFSMDHSQISDGTDAYTLPRVGVDNTHNIIEFRGMGTSGAVLIKQIGKKILPSEVYD